ncbi:MAG: D-alanyl-D-alanine carboxypeptidase [Eubacterium sp.]|nr:D-alanyl-D-alanine carboxypeptidase [Eubacterium sp.]
MKRSVLYFLLTAVYMLAFFSDKMPVLAKEKETTIKEGELYARSAVLMDADSGRILFEKEGNVPLPMASTTKIMTCILALENGNLEEEVEVSEYAASMPDVQLHIRAGEHYQLKHLLYSLMLESHNDSAVAIAEHIGGSVEGFADMMNQKAKEIGCKQTCFITPNGLDAQKEVETPDGKKETVAHSTTAADLARIMSYCIKTSPKQAEFLEITRTDSYSFSNAEGSRKFSCRNHNAFLQMMQGALSGKTGFTGKAGYCYVGALERDGRTFVAALLACGWPNHKTYKWSDTKKLMKYGLSNFEKHDLSEDAVSGEWLKAIPVADAQSSRLYESTAVDVYIKDDGKAPVLLMKQGERAQVSCEVKQALTAPVAKDQEVGTIRYLLDGEVLWERKICTSKELKKRDYIWFFKMAAANFVL